MKFIKSIDKEKLIQLITGIAGIYFCFFIGSILHQYILKQKYTHRITGQQTAFKQISGLVAFQRLVIWVYGAIYNRFTLPKQKRITLPFKNNILCATMSFVGFVTSAYAISMVSYPIVMIFKSCSILSVIMIAVFCTRVTNKNLKLGGKKILVALAVSVGIIIFKVFDPQAKQGDQKKTQLWGLLVLFISLLADGFVPDFQAQIKSLYNPQPTVMMTQINKWCFVVSIISTIISGQLFDFLQFMWYYPLLDIHMISMTSLAFFGNIFVYTMIKNFKQHIVPFVITTRKIISVGLSVLFYKHQTALLQILGLLIVFSTTIFQFISQISKPQTPTQKSIKLQQNEKTQLQTTDRSEYEKVNKQNKSPHKSIQLVRQITHKIQNQYDNYQTDEKFQPK